MKTPLRYQITEFDCGTTTFINALAYLYEREDIPVTLIKNVYKYTLDNEGKSHIVGEGGTSNDAVRRLTHWITTFANCHEFGLKLDLLLADDVSLQEIRKCIADHGCVIARCYQVSEHYVLITDIDDDYVYIWDPYYFEENYYDKDDCVHLVNGKSTYNRMVRLARLMGESKKDFSLMEKDKREVLLMNKVYESTLSNV